MKETKQLMQQILTDDVRNMTDKEALELYSKNKDSRVIAKYFLDMYPTITAMITRSPHGTLEDRISLILSAIDRALTVFDIDKKTDIRSFIVTCYKWYLTDISEWNQRKGRNTPVSSLDTLIEVTDGEPFEAGFIKDYEHSYLKDRDDVEFRCLLKDSGLDEAEISICIKLTQANKVIKKDVYNDLGYTYKQYKEKENSIKNKLSFLINSGYNII